MKHLILVLSFILITSFSISQNLVQEGKTWNVVTCSFGCSTESFRINGDTLLDQTRYNKLYYTYDTTLNNWIYYGGIRENNDKVYMYYKFDENERLLYDFTLAAGDVFSTYYNWCNINLKLESIDSVTLLNGEQRERFNFMGSESWIKGIGCSLGLVYVGFYICEFDVYRELSCCFENNEQIYQSPSFDNCMIISVGLIEKENLATHTLFPNPLSNSCILKFNYIDSQEYKLQIINQNAQNIETIENIKSGEIEIRKGKMNKGLYYYRLQTKKGIIASGMMIVN